MTRIPARSVVELVPTTHYRKVGDRFLLDHVALLEDGRRVVVPLPERSVA
jgi:hypothetical protein